MVAPWLKLAEGDRDVTDRLRLVPRVEEKRQQYRQELTLVRCEAGELFLFAEAAPLARPGVADAEMDAAADEPGLSRPHPDLNRDRLQDEPDGRVRRIVFHERDAVADRPGTLPLRPEQGARREDRRRLVDAPGVMPQLGADDAELLMERLERIAGKVADRVDAEPPEMDFHLRADSPHFADRGRMNQSFDVVEETAGDTRLLSMQVEDELGEDVVRSDADRDRDSGITVDGRADEAGDMRIVPEQPLRPRQVDERLIDRVDANRLRGCELVQDMDDLDGHVQIVAHSGLSVDDVPPLVPRQSVNVEPSRASFDAELLHGGRRGEDEGAVVLEV